MKRVLILFLISISDIFSEERIPLPKDFILGAGTSAYQIEGAWNEDGKGESIWDHLVHTHPELFLEGSNGDIAADSYHKIEEDIKVLKEMKLNSYRFSISWTRVLPKGDLSEINEKGLDYYNKLINRLIEEKIEPMVTIFHWDLPEVFQYKFGGWTNPLIADYFVDYAWLLFSRFGDRVKWWITFNEPYFACTGYANIQMFRLAPAVNASGVGDYMCGYSLLLSHAKAYRLYEKEFREKQNGKLGLALSVLWGQPKTSNEEDIQATQRVNSFQLDWFAHPVYSQSGDYPSIMIEHISNSSKNQGLGLSRLPKFSQEEIILIRGSADFIGVNYYTAKKVSVSVDSSENLIFNQDLDIVFSDDPSWTKSNNLDAFNIVPEGIAELLKYVHKEYPNYDIFITENGIPDYEKIEDDIRVNYILSHLKFVLEAVKNESIPLKGYYHWSLIDNFEWNSGYSLKFGLCHIDFNSPNRTRTLKKSANVFKDIVEQWSVPT